MFANVTLSLMGGFVTTIQLFCLTLVFALPLGLIISFGSMSRFTPLRALVKTVVWAVRGTPLMLQIIVIFYGPALLWGMQAPRFGAAVLMAPEEAGGGENVLQKGYATAGGQYKLQVDGESGKPSCGMSDKSSTTVHIARSRESIADGEWHALECRRSGSTLSVVVDDQVKTSVAIPATLSVVTAQPLSVGGKGVGADNDQFHGTLDDIWVRVD